MISQYRQQFRELSLLPPEYRDEESLEKLVEATIFFDNVAESNNYVLYEKIEAVIGEIQRSNFYECTQEQIEEVLLLKKESGKRKSTSSRNKLVLNLHNQGNSVAQICKVIGLKYPSQIYSILKQNK